MSELELYAGCDGLTKTIGQQIFISIITENYEKRKYLSNIVVQSIHRKLSAVKR